MIIDRHSAKRGQWLWALIGGQPHHVRFVQLSPYQGFVYSVNGIDDEQLASDEAYFATERRDLLDFHVARQLAKIKRAMEEIERLQSIT